MRTRIHNDKEQVFCDWRRRFVRLTPEEWVRQNVLHLLVDTYHYPMTRIGVEVSITVAGLHKRCDAVAYTADMQPIMLIEFKAESIALTQKVLDQAAVYNRRLHVPYLFLSNGKQSIVMHLNDSQCTYLDHIPTWQELTTDTPQPAQPATDTQNMQKPAN